jgi:Golgi nucleoside diphosphatase
MQAVSMLLPVVWVGGTVFSKQDWAILAFSGSKVGKARKSWAILHLLWVHFNAIRAYVGYKKQEDH